MCGYSSDMSFIIKDIGPNDTLAMFIIIKRVRPVVIISRDKIQYHTCIKLDT